MALHVILVYVIATNVSSDIYN